MLERLNFCLMSRSEIKASIDLDGKDAGTHKVSVKVTAPNGLEARSISPQEIDVSLEPK